MGRSEPKQYLQRKTDFHAARYFYTLACLVGQTVTIRLKDNRKIQGIFHACNSTDNNDSFILQFAREIPTAEFHLSGEITPTLIIKGVDVVSMTTESVPLVFDDSETENKRTTGFKTDVEISGGTGGEERELEKWEPEATDPATVGGALEDRSVGWDQFEVNARRFQVKSTYQEEFYTTPLDVTAIPQSVRDKADQIAREIETAQYGQFEEQIHEGDLDDDEEARFGAVRGTGAYKAPQRTSIPKSVQDAAKRVKEEGAPVAQRTVLPKMTNLSDLRLGQLRQTRMAGSLVKNINALNLEPALPKLDEKGRSDLFSKHANNSVLSNRIVTQRALPSGVDRALEKENFVSSLTKITAKMTKMNWTSKGKPSKTPPKRTEGKQVDAVSVHSVGSGVSSKNFRFNPNADTFTPSGKSSDRWHCSECTAAENTEQAKCTHGPDGEPVAADEGSPRPSFKTLTEAPLHRQSIDELLMHKLLPLMVSEAPAGVDQAWNSDMPKKAKPFSYSQILGDTQAVSSAVAVVGKAWPESKRAAQQRSIASAEPADKTEQKVRHRPSASQRKPSAEQPPKQAAPRPESVHEAPSAHSTPVTHAQQPPQQTILMGPPGWRLSQEVPYPQQMGGYQQGNYVVVARNPQMIQQGMVAYVNEDGQAVPHQFEGHMPSDGSMVHTHAHFMDLTGQNVMVLPPGAYLAGGPDGSKATFIQQGQPGGRVFEGRQNEGPAQPDENRPQQAWVGAPPVMIRPTPPSPSRMAHDSASTQGGGRTDDCAMVAGTVSTQRVMPGPQYSYQMYPQQAFGSPADPSSMHPQYAGFPHGVAFPAQGGSVMGMPHQFGYVAAGQFPAQQQHIVGQPSQQSSMNFKQQQQQQQQQQQMGGGMNGDGHGDGPNARMGPRTPSAYPNQGSGGYPANPGNSGNFYNSGYAGNPQTSPSRQMSLKHQNYSNEMSQSGSFSGRS